MTSGSKLFCVCIFLILNLLSLYALAQPGGEFTDLRDGQTYGYVQIGDQAWMAENLNYESPDSWCYDNVPENCSIYGRLYTWESALAVCPVGWHLPTDEEWKMLEQFIGMTRDESDIFLYRGEGHGTKLMDPEAWPGDWSGRSLYNTVGFKALPAGFRMWDGIFLGKGKDGRWWTCTENQWHGNTYAYRRCLESGKTGIDRDAATFTLAFSVRCVRDDAE